MSMILLLVGRLAGRGGVIGVVGAVLAGSGGLAAASVSPRFMHIGDLAGGTTSSQAVAVSADGSVVSGLGHSATQEAVIWTEAGGLHGLGILTGASDALGISGDGNVIVGEGVYTSNVVGPFRSSRTGPIQAMPMLAGASPASGWAASASYDGSVIVGQSRDSTGIQAVRWTGAGIAALGNMAGIANSEANGVSADGSVIVGLALTATSDASAFRWTQGTGMQSIGFLGPTQVPTSANAISADGNVIVGYSTPSAGREAFRWTAAGGMVGLGDLPGGIVSSVAFGTSADGSVIVGSSSTGTSEQAFVWTQGLGMVPLRQYLTMNGVTGMNGWTLAQALGISADGTTIVGYGTNPTGQQEGFVAVVPAPASLLGCTALLWAARRRRSGR